ncbi:ankyrin repeat and zinc finger domain-containing protein 1-like [Patiria miniata]|uniref:VLRF1 domain-containing protein n=1 Tax=Patiria miniata TaxID=46514 RepID=A0A913Z214_PATMI|nr:ankyrin repeat and zinc finger domain-containing protein 1-like [Patiria miniata]
MAEADVESQKAAMSTNPDETNLSSQDETKKKVATFHLYDPDISTSLLKGIMLSSCQLNTEIDEVVEESNDGPVKRPETEVYAIATKKTCLLCSCNFTSRQQQIDHYKLDWHRFNLKQRMIGAPAVTEEQFENISGDVSSISGSDSSTDDDSDNDSDRSPYFNSGSRTPDSPNLSAKRREPDHHVKGRRHPKVFFRNSDGQLLSVQRCVLHGKRDMPTTQQELVAMATQLPIRMRWLVLMIGGGHFAGAIFDGKEVPAHKTFHRYTVRAKRGTAQGMRDSQQGGNQPKSAGASLRRYNEAALVEDIHALLACWDDQIRDCHRIFLRAPSYNKNAFFGGKNPPLDRRDERIVTIPFATRRPTFKEIQRVHGLLSTVDCYGNAVEAERRIMEAHSPKISQPKKTTKMKQDENTQKTTEEVENSKGKRSESEGEVDLVMVEEEISTLDLQEFETNVGKHKRPKKKRKPRKKQENKDDQDKSNNKMDALCEACRKGDWDQLKAMLTRPANEEGTNNAAPTMEGKTDVEETSQILETKDCDLPRTEQNIQHKGIENSITENETALKHAAEEHGNKVHAFGKEDSNTEDLALESDDKSLANEIQQGKHCQNSEVKDCPLLPGNEEGMLGNQQGMMGNGGDLADVVNRPVDELGNTLLHVAVQAERATILWNLMECGADPAIKNRKGQVPYVLCNNKELRKEFRRFMAAHPGKYNYEQAQIPSPLTSDKEEMRAAKAAEKKRIQKKNKRIREQEQKEEQKRQEEERRKREAEEEEKRKFASLSDREKRALAAERRFQAQLAVQGATATETTQLSNTKRCWLCGTSLVGKVPFEYLDYKFCTIQCVKQHKQQQKTSTT